MEKLRTAYKHVRTNECALRQPADCMQWQSRGYIDTEHEFPVTEVWR